MFVKQQILHFQKKKSILLTLTYLISENALFQMIQVTSNDFFNIAVLV